MTKKRYCGYCGELLENGCECDLEEENAVRDYENSPETHLGWAQQDLIDSFRRER